MELSFRHGAEEREYTLGPGRAALVSHWMLRTIHREAKAARNDSLVVFVEPGKFREHRISIARLPHSDKSNIQVVRQFKGPPQDILVAGLSSSTTTSLRCESGEPLSD